MLLILILGMKEEFLWSRPGWKNRLFDLHCNAGKLANCAAINEDDPTYCDVCIFDDGTGEARQPFIKKNFDSYELKGKDGCELNLRNPGNEEGPGGNLSIISPVYPANVGSGYYGVARFPIDPDTTGVSRFTNVPGENKCLEGAYDENAQYARFKHETLWETCRANNYYKSRCIMPVSKIKQWAEEGKVINGLDFNQIDELPDTGNIYGKYYKAWATGEHNC